MTQRAVAIVTLNICLILGLLNWTTFHISR